MIFVEVVKRYLRLLMPNAVSFLVTGIILGYCCFTSYAHAVTLHKTIQLKNVEQQLVLLNHQKKLLDAKIDEISQERKAFNANFPSTLDAAEKLYQQLKMRANVADIMLADLQQSLQNAEIRSAKLNELQKSLQLSLLNEQGEEARLSTSEQLKEISIFISKNEEEINLISLNVELADKLAAIYHEYLIACSTLIEKINKERAIKDLRQQINEEQAATDKWLKNMNTLSRNKDENRPPDHKILMSQILDESHLFYYTQRVHLSSIKVASLEMAIDLLSVEEDFKTLTENTPPIKTDSLKKLLNTQNVALQSAKNALDKYQKLVQQQQTVLQEAIKNQLLTTQQAVPLEGNFNELKNIMVDLSDMLLKNQLIIQNYGQKLDAYMAQMLAKRQAILKTNEQLAAGFIEQINLLPNLMRMYLGGLCQQVWHNILALSLGYQVILALIMLLSTAIWYLGKKYYRILSDKVSQVERRASSRTVYIIFELLRRNWGGLCLFLDLWFILYWSGMSFSAYVGLFYIALVWFAFRIIVGIARFLLIDLVNDESGHDVRLYHRLKWSFVIGGWITVMMVLSRQFPMGGSIAEITNRLFMGFLLSVSLLLFKARKFIPDFVDPLIQNRKYLIRAIHMVCWVLPLGVIISSVIGLLGYINLAWILIYYQAVMVLVMTGYAILRGVFTDLFTISSEWVIKNLNQGWLWSEAFIKPVDKVIHIFLFFLTVMAVFLLFGWRHDSPFVAKALEVLNHPFFYFSGINVSLVSITEFVVLVAFFYWLSKWTREFAYRWVFRNAKDIGIRNSLAVFSQYTVVTLGIIITLRILGIDFTGLSVILGGLAVGLGFGLRDFASNIVGGLMILIERSVKEGDVVSIGSYEGEVTHIGIRAMRIRSWDHMEIMVPNAEILMKTFTNWTHQDSIVRTVIPLRVHRTDDPVAIQKMVLSVLERTPEVLRDPEPQVLITQVDEALVAFEIRYFMNIALYVRVEVRSKVLLEILRVFKEAGIRPPYPQVDSYSHSIDEHHGYYEVL